MLLIYSPVVTNRLTYIFDLIFRELLGLEFRITSLTDEFTAWTDPKINYSGTNPGNGLYFRASGILFENTIVDQKIDVVILNGSLVFYAHSDASSVLPFDPFAAAFYMVSRYEEYLPFESDKYDRFDPSTSIAYKNKFLQTPVVNKWALQIKEALQSRYPGILFRPSAYRFIPTIDIDHAYAYLYRKFYRVFGSYGRSFIRGDWKDVLLRTQVLLGSHKDPYDNYSWMESIHQPHQLVALYFILFADYGGNDNNVTTRKEGFHKLIRLLDKNSSVGIHPSLSSTKHFSRLTSEIHHLEHVLQRKIVASRQHFLKVRLPKTYRDLIETGITDDYSMGYASVPGFRAGIVNSDRKSVV